MTQQIENRLSDWALAPVVEAMQALRGVALIAAATIVAEMGDISRFSKAEQLMSYLGLVPSKNCSGKRRRQGGRITKAGNGAARRVLIEAAWSYRFPARVSQDQLLRQESWPHRSGRSPGRRKNGCAFNIANSAVPANRSRPSPRPSHDNSPALSGPSRTRSARRQRENACSNFIKGDR